MKFCKDCKHVGLLGDYYYCQRPLQPNLVTGEVKHVFRHCEDERKDHHTTLLPETCGTEGKCWEAKENVKPTA